MITFEIKKVNGLTFGTKNIWCEPTGFAPYVPGKGFLAFQHDNENRRGVRLPYLPKGGKKALQAILDAGGFLSLEGMEFVQPRD